MDQLPNEFTNSDEIMGNLTKVIGRLLKDVTTYKVVEAGETIPKVEGPFILVDLSDLSPLDWETNQIVENGITHTVHNYTATYTLTAYRGKPHWALTRFHQALSLAWIRDKYFPVGSPYAYSSTSSIARLRIPLNEQYYENRARVLITFNVTFVESDFGQFENIESIIIDTGVSDPSGNKIENEALIDINVKPGGDGPSIPPEPDIPFTYIDTIVTVNEK